MKDKYSKKHHTYTTDQIEDSNLKGFKDNYGAVDKKAKATPFLERHLVHDKPIIDKPFKISYGTGEVEGNIARD